MSIATFIRRLAIGVIAVTACSSPSGNAQSDGSASDNQAANPRAQQQIANDLPSGAGDAALYSGLKARLVGPAGMSGRIAAIDAVADDPRIIVVGASTGGLWISRNGGLNFDPVFDDQPVASIGAVAINQKNPDIIWVGTGEGNVRNSTSVGGGMYKSVDGGKTFSYLGLAKTERINRIALHPTDPNIAYVAALGQLWSENAERGVYKTVDGGETWNKILYTDEKTGATDIQMTPGNPDKLFASMWQFRRWPYFFKSGGPGSGMYVSHDGGANWKELTQEDGMPAGTLGRSAFAISKSNPNRVYALVEADKSALARSDDGGRSWSLVNQDIDINDRPFYYNDLAVDPKDPNRVYRVGSRVKLSIDGGNTFDYMPAIDCCAAGNDVHIDTHAWWINPNNPSHMIDGNDGGIAITQDKGVTWRFVENLPLAQFYHIAVDDAVPYNIYGGLQDNGSWKGPSEIWENGGIRNLHWREVAFGDGFDTIPDPENHRQGYAMSQGGTLYRWNLDTGELRLIKPPAKVDDDGKPIDMRYNWNAGLAQDPFDPATIYYGSQFLHKSTDRGITWEIISDDLTTNNRDFQTFRKSGGLTSDVTAAENYTSITTIAPSPIDAGVIWVGTDDGRVHVTRDGGETWSSIEDGATRGSGAAPRGAWVPMIDPSAHDASVAFVTMDDHRRGHMKPHAFRVSGYGSTWTSIITPEVNGYAISIRQDPVDPDLLFLGTEFGLHVSLDGGANWIKWTQGVPTVSVADLAIQDRESDLIIGTHGRAAFVIDDYSALRNLSADDFSKRFALLSVGDGQQYSSQQAPSSRFTGSGEFRADNEPYGVMITFMANGNDLSHPDDARERERKIAERQKKAAEQEETPDPRLPAPEEDEAEEPETQDTNSEDKTEEAPPEEPSTKATITVTDADGTLVRTFKQDVHQGINRVIWSMQRDGIMPAPPAEGPEDGTLPAGLSVLPGVYTVSVKFEDTEENAQTNVLSDPRTPYSAEALRESYAMRLQMQEMQGIAIDALTRIDDARRDATIIADIIALQKKRANVEPSDKEHPLNKLEKQASDLKDQLNAAETLFRVPADTKGIVYDDDKVMSKIGTAQFYLGSTNDAPGDAARQAMTSAQTALHLALAKLNTIIAQDLPEFRTAAESTGLILLSQEPITVEQ